MRNMHENLLSIDQSQMLIEMAISRTTKMMEKLFA